MGIGINRSGKKIRLYWSIEVIDWSVVYLEKQEEVQSLRFQSEKYL